ncbi:hypothetical protein TTHERM_00037320 (macronuclear) [Tetrahymena thermophila SB210]|uniref:Transmembrane protein n=1 Tax=Tetrahymena thermophila (strain SB210) TaxID=312017 RepID=Q22M87_TETTS|nr:hypothetical protein TTHERM_00037320 [Tetrahymena thermophila SB210]EAR86312.2 hypothetical protein TTHERM_00037320 [Tetrahymena thermophila SB210]|eukprot:XP_977133.2 hypothetical protein TTHERM_00037320 [Tetrahymena thermophila SB210]
MKKLALLIIHLIFCICATIPNPPNKRIVFTLYDAKIKFYSNQDYVSMKVDFSSNISYFTSPDCVNCLIYNDNQPATVQCSTAANACIVKEKFSEKINQYYSAQGDVVQIRIYYQEEYNKQIQKPLIIEKAFYVKNVFQNSKDQRYEYYSLGLGFDKSIESSFLSAFYKQGKIDQLSYSLYLSSDNIYILTLGGYDLKLISGQFIIMKNIESQKYNSDIYQANIEFFGQPIESFGQDQKAATVYIDPNIQDEIILPQYMLNKMQQILSSLRQEPDLQAMTIDNPGQWSSINDQQTLGLHFFAEDVQGQLDTNVDVLFNQNEFMEQYGEGYRPRISFNVDKDEKILKIGRMLLKKFMLYKYNPDQPREPIIRAFAPLKKHQSQQQE